jgi:type I restriction enzyme, S subunit
MFDKNTIPKHWRVSIFFDLLDYYQPANYIVESTDYDRTYKTPVLTAGKSFIIGYTNEKVGIFNSIPVIIFDDFTTATQFVNFPFKVKSSAMKILKPRDENVNIKFIFYYMQTVHLKSETHKRYWISEYSKLSIPVPPLIEQHQIVSKIEELFSELDKGKQQLEKVRQQLKTYRLAVLKWAFEGRFTSYAATGRDLFADDQNKPKLPEGWKWVKLSDITEYITDGDHQPPPKTDFGIPFITISNVNKSDKKIDFTDTFKVSEEYYLNLKDNRKPKVGDILYTVTGSFGIPIMVDFNERFCFQRHIGLIHPSLKSDQRWLYYNLQTQAVINQAKATATGTAQKTVALKSLRNFEIPYCSIEEQKKIVKEIESRLSVCDKLEEIIETCLKQSESLRQSILKQAFQGKLVESKS